MLIHAEESALGNIMGAAHESDIAASCTNDALGANYRIKLTEMGDAQLATPLELDNATAYGILTKQLTLKRSKAIYMRFYWLRDRNNQNLG